MTDFNNLKDVTARVRYLIEKRHVTDRQFAIMCGIDPSNFSRKLLGKQPWTKNDFGKMAKVGINPDWLADGSGEPFEGCEEEEKKKVQEPTTATKPRLPMRVVAGMISEYYEGTLRSQCKENPIIHQFSNYDFTMIVKGNSMEPKFEGGDEIACKKVNSIIEWGKSYVIDTRDGAFLKRVYEEDENTIRCVSYNNEYPDFKVSKDEIFGIFRVVGVLRL